jgi:hypothetical protein
MKFKADALIGFILCHSLAVLAFFPSSSAEQVSSSWSLECSRLAFLESISGLSLDLSPEQMRLIYASLPEDRARTELRIRLALGAAIPRSVELFVFPDALIA